MPLKDSRSAKPWLMLNSTNLSQSSPAATSIIPPLQASYSSAFPLFSTLITVPANPASLINKLEPPPKIKTGSFASSALLTN